MCGLLGNPECVAAIPTYMRNTRIDKFTYLRSTSEQKQKQKDRKLKWAGETFYVNPHPHPHLIKENTRT